MQSGIAASQELLDAFNALTTDSSQRALIAGIKNEALVPITTVPLKGSFSSDIDALQSQLSATEAAYILVKVAPDEPNGYAAVTFVPNAAPVRQKMLFASTRLTLVRELGIERFRDTLFATELNELTAEGWKKHEAHSKLKAPLTEEEEALGSVKAAEAAESQGTGGRRMHADRLEAFRFNDDIVQALEGLQEPQVLVQLKFDLPDEHLKLDLKLTDITPSALGSSISASEPRYSFYSYPSSGSTPQVLFIYSCPPNAKIKEKMMYSTAKIMTRKVAEQQSGIIIAKSMEASDPSDLLPDELKREMGPETQSDSKSFSRPKRPGRK